MAAPTFVSLFTGIGGLDLGLERAGWTCIGQAEWDCLPAAAFGAPHRRERIFIVAYPDGLGPETGARVLTRVAVPGLGQPSAWGSLSRRGAGGRVRRIPDDFLQLVADGTTDGLDHVGNAIVPQVAELIGRRILEAAA